jgi:SAM-dependent methyltransferase
MAGRRPVALKAYEMLAERYAAMVDGKAENAHYERPATLSLLPPVGGKRILDAGCGPGWYAEWLVNHGADVVGIDASPKMIRLARKRLGGRAVFQHADLGRPLGFLDDADFDIVLCPVVLDYVEDWEALFAEFNRLLKGFGLLVFSTGHPLTAYFHHLDTSYFDTVQVEDTWTGFGIEVKVPYYRRPLSAILTPLLHAGFSLEALLEPRPSQNLKAVDAKVYERLAKEPGVVCVRARKATRLVKSPHLLR